MASYAPTITVNNTPGLQAQMPGTLTYNEFLQSLGQYVYEIRKYYISSTDNNIKQLLQPVYYEINDANGLQEAQVIVHHVDPYQASSSFIEDCSGKNIYLDGNSSFNLNLLAGEQITLSLFTNETAIIDDINKYGKSNFEIASDPLKNIGLYKEYLDTLP